MKDKKFKAYLTSNSYSLVNGGNFPDGTKWGSYKATMPYITLYKFIEDNNDFFNFMLPVKARAWGGGRSTLAERADSFRHILHAYTNGRASLMDGIEPVQLSLVIDKVPPHVLTNLKSVKETLI